MYPPLECVFSSYITSWTEKLARVTVFCVNIACLSLTCFFQVQSGQLSWLLQDWVRVLVPCPILSGHLTCFCLHPSAWRGHVFSVLRLQPLYPLHHFWRLRQPQKSKQFQKCAIYGVQENQTDPQMIDLMVAAGPGCRQTANEVIFLNAKCKQDNSFLPRWESLWVSLPLLQFSAEMHAPVCVFTLLWVELCPVKMIC